MDEVELLKDGAAVIHGHRQIGEDCCAAAVGIGEGLTPIPRELCCHRLDA